MCLQNKISDAAGYIRSQFSGECPETAVVLGSGLGRFCDTLRKISVVEGKKIPNWPLSTVSGHEGSIIFGSLGKARLFVQKGRVHFYEGYSIQEVVFPVRVMWKLGVKNLILTNAAGSLNRNLQPGDIFLAEDHINLMFTNPLIGRNDLQMGTRFPDMSCPYDESLIAAAESAASEMELNIKKGVLTATVGPCYETCAEAKMIRKLGGDAVCMSTVPETIAAVHLGIRVMSLSSITNFSTSLSDKNLDHREVEIAAGRSSERMNDLIIKIISHIYRKRVNL